MKQIDFRGRATPSPLHVPVPVGAWCFRSRLEVHVVGIHRGQGGAGGRTQVPIALLHGVVAEVLYDSSAEHIARDQVGINPVASQHELPTLKVQYMNNI